MGDQRNFGLPPSRMQKGPLVFGQVGQVPKLGQFVGADKKCTCPEANKGFS